MKAKLISLLTCLALNGYAANTIISVPSTQLNNYTVIRAEIPTISGIKSATQNCANLSYCDITMAGVSLAPGVYEINIYAANNGKKIASAPIEKFANLPGDDIYNINLNLNNLNLSSLATPEASRSSIDGNSLGDYKEISQRVGASFKIIAAIFPQFKPVSDFAGGIVELIFPKNSGGSIDLNTTNKQLFLAIDLISQVGTQVKILEDKLINFYTQYNKDRFQDKISGLNSGLAIINQLSQQVSYTLKSSNNSLIEYMKAHQKTERLTTIMDFFQKDRNAAELALGNILGKNGDNLTNIKSVLDSLMHETSRDNAKVNYIALNSFYNAEYIKCYTDILAAIASMQQIDILGATLISKDFQYANIYAGHISIKIDGVLPQNTIQQNAAIVREFYAKKIQILLDKLPINQNTLKDVYGPAGLKFNDSSRFSSEGRLDPTKLLSLAGLAITSYDGTTLVGTYGGNSRSNWPTAAVFSLPFQSYQNSKVHVINDQAIFIPQNAVDNSYDGIVRLEHVDHTEFRTWWGKDGAKWNSDVIHWRKSRFYNSKAFNDIPVYSELNYQHLVRLYEEGNAHHYEWNRPMEVINGNHIRMNRPNYETNVSKQGDVEPRYAIYAVSGGNVPANTQYAFGVKYGAWGNTSILKSECNNFGCDARWRDEWAWGFRLFCPTFICKQLDDRTLAYPDGTFVVISGERGNTHINVTRDPNTVNWRKYTITTSFRFQQNESSSYNYFYYSPKISGISSGSHNLAPNSTDVFYNKEKVVGFKYSYGMQDINKAGQDDTPSFNLKMENGFCHSYSTKFGKNLKTCVSDKGNNHFEINTID